MDYTHNFNDESLKDKLGCDSFPIRPWHVVTFLARTVEMVSFRTINNFQLSLDCTQFSDIVLAQREKSLCNLCLIALVAQRTEKIPSKSVT